MLLATPAFFAKDDGFVKVNKVLLGGGTSFPCSLDVDGVRLSVQVPEILSGSKWTGDIPVQAQKEMYLRPPAQDHDPIQNDHTSFWIEAATSGTTRIWAFRAFPKDGGTGSNVKLSILQVGIVVTGGKMKLVGAAKWVPQTFNACPAGFSPVEAIVFDQGDGRPRFLALVMRSSHMEKTLMHCHELPEHLYSDVLCPRWA